MSRTPTIKRRRTAQDWARLVEAWERSGQSARVFGEAHGVAPERLPWWRWHLGRKRTGPRLELVEVEVERDGVGAGWELRSASGDVLRVEAPMTAECLREVLAALGRRRAR